MAKNEFDITSLTPEQRDARLALDVERLLRFGRKHKLIKDLDILVARNTLLDLLALAAPSEAKPPKAGPPRPRCPAGRDRSSWPRRRSCSTARSTSTASTLRPA